MLIREAFLDDLNAVGHMEIHFANEGMYAGCKKRVICQPDRSTVCTSEYIPLRQASTLRLITELSHSLYKGH
jgi:hypothetical protein